MTIQSPKSSEIRLNLGEISGENIQNWQETGKKLNQPDSFLTLKRIGNWEVGKSGNWEVGNWPSNQRNAIESDGGSIGDGSD